MSYMPQAKTDDWATPQDLFDKWNDKYQFTLDVAASSSNRKCSQWFGLDHPELNRRNGLTAQWYGSVWCNPPYGRQIKDWVAKAYAYDGVTVMLLPARTDTLWFHTYLYTNDRVKIEFIKGRVKYGNGTTPAPFPSMMVVFRAET